MDYRVSEVFNVLSLLLAQFHVIFSFFLQCESEFSAPSDALAAHFKAFVHLEHGSLIRGVKAKHAAASGLVIHYVELLVQEGVEPDLSLTHALIEIFKDLIIHVLDSALIILFVQSEEIL